MYTDKEKEQLYIIHIDDLYDYGRSFGFSHDMCMDAIQDVFVRLFTKKPATHPNKLKPYLFRCLKHRLIDLYRSNRYVLYDKIDDNLFSLEMSVQDSFISKEDNFYLQSRLQEFLNQLTPKQKEVLYLRYFQELEYEEIAQIMHISAESTRKLVYRTIKKIRANADIAYPTILLLLSFY